MAKPDTGDLIVASALGTWALLISLGFFGVPFADWIGAPLVFVHGILLRTGHLGAHGTIGIALMIAGPAYLIVPLFWPAIGVVVKVVVMVGLWALAGTKLARLW